MSEEIVPTQIPEHEHDGLQGECTICNANDEFKARRAEVDEHLCALIAEHGYTMMGVMSGGEDEPSFAYTIGLCAQNLPEILLVGNLPPPVMERIIALLAKRWVTNDVADFGVCTDLLVNAQSLGTELRTKIIDVDPAYAAEHYTCQVRRFFPDHADYRVAQVLWPDMNGLLPDEAGYITNAALCQPVLPLVQ